MRRQDGTLSRKGLVVVGSSMIVVSVIVLFCLFIGVSHSDLRISYDLAQETATFLEENCEQ